ncbi:hypothetical protein NPIL_190611, partial [Nephila pilipes]
SDYSSPDYAYGGGNLFPYDNFFNPNLFDYGKNEFLQYVN